MRKQIIVVGRGQSGTRIPIDIFRNSGIFCGRTNPSGDLYVNRKLMYEAVRLFGQMVEVYGNYEWNFSKPLLLDNPSPEYANLVRQFLAEFDPLSLYAWKLPEATMALPWLVKLYPDAYYIHWVRDGRDNILHWHGTEDIWYGVDIGDLPKDRLFRAALSWDYHEELIAQTPKPAHWLMVRFEDMIANPNDQLQRMEDFLNMGLFGIRLFAGPVGRYHDYDLTPYLPILQRHLVSNGYMEELVIDE